MTKLSAQRENETDAAYVLRHQETAEIIAKRHTLIGCHQMCRHMVMDIEKNFHREAAQPVLVLLMQVKQLLDKMPEVTYEV